MNVSEEEELGHKNLDFMRRLQEAECVATVRFCNWFHQTVYGGEYQPLLT